MTHPYEGISGGLCRRCGQEEASAWHNPEFYMQPPEAAPRLVPPTPGEWVEPYDTSEVETLREPVTPESEDTSKVQPVKSDEPPSQLRSHLFVGNNPKACDLCGWPRHWVSCHTDCIPFEGSSVKPVVSSEPPSPLVPHLFTGHDPVYCGLCGLPKDILFGDGHLHTDWDYKPEVTADQLEDAHGFKGTGEQCATCGRSAAHLIHGMHAPETGLPSLEERKVAALEEIAGALHRIEDHFRECMMMLEDGSSAIRVWHHGNTK